MAEKPGKIRELTVSELDKKERELISSLFNLRMQVVTKRNNAFAQIKLLRRDIARVKTIRSEIERKGKQESVKEENG
ncbi:50S ribosomal protein L29 [Candidatus Mycalebacterium sp.]